MYRKKLIQNWVRLPRPKRDLETQITYGPQASLLSFWWRILLLFCYFVLALHPLHASCEPEVCVFPVRAVFLRS